MVNCDNIFWICYDYCKAHLNYAYGTTRLNVCRGCVFFLLKIKLKEQIYFKLLAVKGANMEDVMTLSHYRSPAAQQFIIQLTYTKAGDADSGRSQSIFILSSIFTSTQY